MTRVDEPEASTPRADPPDDGSGRSLRAAQRALRREQRACDDPEPSLGARLGQIGLLGWMIVVPALLCLWAGHRVDRLLGTGVMFSAALLMLGVALGMWSSWKWMHRQEHDNP